MIEKAALSQVVVIWLYMKSFCLMTHMITLALFCPAKMIICSSLKEMSIIKTTRGSLIDPENVVFSGIFESATITDFIFKGNTVRSNNANRRKSE
jgi:hypothetical protein